MTKRALCFLLVLTMLVCAFPISASAATDTEIRNQITRCYRKTLAANGVSDLDGFCGQLSGYMLYFLGVEKYPVTLNGKDMYDYYLNKDVTSGGCRVRPYSGKKYSLESALNAISNNGSRTVYNILIGFQRTSSEAGQRYGHAMVIHAIMDGYVYYTDSFDTFRGPAGTPFCLTISEFAQYYCAWAVFEGAVMFGKADYMEMCQLYTSSGYVMLNRDTPVISKICEDPQSAPALRVAHSGERMIVTGVMEDVDGRLYYRVTDDGGCAYVEAGAADMICSDYDNSFTQGMEIPAAVDSGKSFTLQAELPAQDSPFEAFEVKLYDLEDELVQTYANSNKKNIKIEVDTEQLPDGCYRLDFVADALNYYVQDDQLSATFGNVVLCSGYLTVGEAELPQQMPVNARGAETVDGWVLRDGIWYCYADGAPRTGWYCDNGIDYYLQADGSVTTGWQNIGGKDRFFSDTGALRTGWLQQDNTTLYMRKNGVAAEGWENVDGVNYYFGENGLVKEDGWLQTEKGLAFLQDGGKALTGWNTVDGNRYFFDAAGMIFSQMQNVDGKSVLVLYEDDPSIAPIM